MPHESIKPFDGKVHKSFTETSNAQLEMALGVAAACFIQSRRNGFSFPATPAPPKHLPAGPSGKDFRVAETMHQPDWIIRWGRSQNCRP